MPSDLSSGVENVYFSRQSSTNSDAGIWKTINCPPGYYALSCSAQLNYDKGKSYNGPHDDEAYYVVASSTSCQFG